MEQFNKKTDHVYFGIPSGSLEYKTRRILEAGNLMSKEISTRLYEFKGLIDGLIFRVCDRMELPSLISLGVVDVGITGADYLFESGFQKNLTVISDYNYAKRSYGPSRLVMVGDSSNVISPEDAKGKRIATELPSLTRARLIELFGYTDSDLRNILHSPGKTEARIGQGLADVVVDITESGSTIRENGLAEISTLFESRPQLIANPNSLSNPNKNDITKLVDIMFAEGLLTKPE